MPEGWRWERLGNCGNWSSGGTPSAKDARYYGGTIPWLTSGELNDAVVSRSEKMITEEGYANSSVKWLPSDTLLVAMYGATIGKAAVTGFRCTTNQAVAACQPHPGYNVRYLLYYVLSQRDTLRNLGQGGAQPNISQALLKDYPCPVAPAVDQQKIVARIDALFSEIDEGVAALAEARAGVETYRKALLKAAVTGELTAAWRAANPPQETGEQLLQRILADRRARWHADPRNTRKKYTEPAGPDTDGLPELPERWAWASLAQLLSGIEAGLNVKAHGRPPAEGETGIVKISAVTWDEFDEGQSKALFLNTKVDERNLIAVGDLLISRANTIELVGAPAIVRRLNKRLVLSDKILRLIVPRKFKEWLYFVIKSTFGRHHIESRSTGNQLSMRNISQDSLRALPVPIPPVEELDMLLDMLHVGWREQRFLSEWLADNSVSSTLHQSILTAAFRGELSA
ncbi:MAG: restriction endonuclease subunit S [Phenylobacterium sp.]|nr:restriction endonuclease subunit S [Phenylobacterium sp.]